MGGVRRGGRNLNGVKRIVRKYLQRGRASRFKKRVRNAAFDNVPWNHLVLRYGYDIWPGGAQNLQTTVISSNTGITSTGNGGLWTAADITAVSAKNDASSTVNEFHAQGKTIDRLVNRGTTTVILKCYKCVARKDCYNASPTGGYENDSTDARSAELAFALGFEKQQTDSGNTLYSRPGSTPYMNRYFCSYWKIRGRPKRIILKPGQMTTLTLKAKERKFKTLTESLGNSVITRTTIKGITTQWLIIAMTIPQAYDSLALTSTDFRVGVDNFLIIGETFKTYKYRVTGANGLALDSTPEMTNTQDASHLLADTTFGFIQNTAQANAAIGPQAISIG